MLIAPPAAASHHLSDAELFAASASGRDKHLADCAWCTHRQELAGADVAAEADDDFEQALRAGQWRDEFKRASREAVLPDQVRALMTAPASVGDVQPGQIWRLSWRGRHLLAAVIEVADWQVLAAPVTTDTGVADELTLLVPNGQSPLTADLAVWVRNRAAIPLFVFDRPLGKLPHIDGAAMSAQAALEQLTRAHLTGCSVPGRLPVGTRLSENDVDRLAMHDALQEQTDWFAAAGAGLVDFDGVLTAAKPHQIKHQHRGRPLPELLRESGLQLRQMAEQTGISMGRLVDLARPGATARPGEIAAIEKATGGEAETDIPGQQLKAVTALTEVSRPAWRAARQRWTQNNRHDAESEDPAALIRHLLEDPVAARSINQGRAADDEQQRLRQYWRERVAMILSAYT
jgi:hypothetical protein